MIRLAIACLLAALPIGPLLAADLPSPAEVFGHEVGADRKLVPYPQVLDYLQKIAAATS